MQPTIGRIVHYKLSAHDAAEINRRRTDSKSIAERLQKTAAEAALPAWPMGAQAHIGKPVTEGQVFPMVVVAVIPDDVHGVNGQVFLDGNDVLWVTSRAEGTEPHTWAWPPRV